MENQFHRHDHIPPTRLGIRGFVIVRYMAIYLMNHSPNLLSDRSLSLAIRRLIVIASFHLVIISFLFFNDLIFVYKLVNILYTIDQCTEIYTLSPSLFRSHCNSYSYILTPEGQKTRVKIQINSRLIFGIIFSGSPRIRRPRVTWSFQENFFGKFTA